MSNPTHMYYPITSSTDYVFPFPYLSPSHVKVAIDGVGAPFELISSNTVRITSEGNIGKTLKVYRETPKTPIHTWEDGTVILGSHMNAANLQSVYIAEEAYGYAEGLAEEAKQYALDGASDALMAALNDAIATLQAAIAGPAADAQEAAEAAELAVSQLAAAVANVLVHAANAEARASEASGSAVAAEAARQALRKLYLGGAGEDPTTDLDGEPLQTGALYFNTLASKMKIWDGTAWQIAYNDITIPPANNSDDVENRSSVTGASVTAALNALATALSGKAATSHTHAQSDITGLSTALAGKSDTGHTHAQSDITGLATALSGKADASAVTAALADKADASALTSGLAGKANTSHAHAIGDLPKAAAADVRGATDDTKLLTTKSVYDSLAEVTLTYAATITPNLANGPNFLLTMTGNGTLANPSGGMTPGRTGRIRVLQDGTGSRTLAYGSYWDFEGGAAPVLSTAASSEDYLDYEVITTTKIGAKLTKAWS